MTQINADHLRKVRILCSSEEHLEELKIFIKKYNMAGMVPVLEKDVMSFIYSDKHNYAIADFGNIEYVTKFFKLFKELNIEVKIFEL